MFTRDVASVHSSIALKTRETATTASNCKQLQTDRRHYQWIFCNNRESVDLQQSLVLVFSEFFGTEVNLQEQFRPDNDACKVCHQLIQTYAKKKTKVQKMEIKAHSLLVHVY